MKKEFRSYPLQFYPILKQRIWGGTKLKTELHKTIPYETTGESWEISTVEGDVSIIFNGEYKEKSLQQLIEDFPTEILGKEVYKTFGATFPLLFKYLDARDDLSIQVHPNDALAKARHNSFGKTEMWYIMQAEVNSRILVGFKEDTNQATYLKHLENKTVVSLLDSIEVQKGDAFMLNTGTVHAIGAGILLAEIQQTSDITYRIYDFDRRDSAGHLRELHTDLALEAINYKKVSSQQNYHKTENKSNTIVDCPYFTTNYLKIDKSISINKTQDTFTVYMCTEGNCTIYFENGSQNVEKGNTILIPAYLNSYQITGNATLLEIYVS